jgi:hypothetical protein
MCSLVVDVGLLLLGTRTTARVRTTASTPPASTPLASTPLASTPARLSPAYLPYATTRRCD